MRITTTPYALLALSTLTHAVSLKDFVPRVDKVSGDCDKVYEQSIPDCSGSDFTGQECSASCVRGLASMTKSVKDACGGEGILEKSDKDNQNILAAFLSDNGPQSLCKGASEILAEAPTTSQEPSTTASPTPTSSPSEASSVVDSTAIAPSSATDIPTSLAIDTSSSPAPTGAETSSTTEESSSNISTATSESSQIFQAPSMSPTSSTSSSESEQTSDAGHSGGGSPFDAAGNEFSGSSATTAASVAAIAFAAGLTVLLAQL